VVYLHSGAWCGLDKDFCTRPLFRHLAAQGHVIVDVAYRTFPETDLPGMVADAKRAVAWVKTHAADLEVRPDRIVLAGGHLALLAAYSHDDPQPDWDAPPPPWMQRLFGPEAGRLGLHRVAVASRLDWLVGGTPPGP
jgi:acetyl esterase/lipase